MFTKIVKEIKHIGVLLPVKKIYWKYRYIFIGMKNEWKYKKEIKKEKPCYFVICYKDAMNVGWSVWERVVLYNCVYAEEIGLIPVVDMKNYQNIYQDNPKDNSWEIYYEQPGNVLLEKALISRYIYCDGNPEWFAWVRKRRLKLYNTKYLRRKYKQYIKHNAETISALNKKWENLIGNLGKRGLAICLRGTDYITFNHGKQPDVADVAKKAKKIYKEYNCDYIYVATEDERLFKEITAKLKDIKLVYFNSKRVSDNKGDYIGRIMKIGRTAYDTSMEYLAILYGLKECICLVGGAMGATIICEYGRNEPYEFFEILK